LNEAKSAVQKIERRHKKNGYIDYWHGYNRGNELGGVLYECEYLAASGDDVTLALQTTYMVLVNVVKNWDNIDDDGTICPLLEECFGLLIKYKSFLSKELKNDINKTIDKTKNSDVKNFTEDYLKTLNAV